MDDVFQSHVMNLEMVLQKLEFVVGRRIEVKPKIRIAAFQKLRNSI
jgi:hypothetical protein